MRSHYSLGTHVDRGWRDDLPVSETFEDHLWTEAARALRDVPAGERADTYVVSFFVYDEEDDPRHPTLTVGTNTESQVTLVTDPSPDVPKPNPWWTPSDPAEARWNYAFWRQNHLAEVGATGTDPVGATLRETWIRGQGLWVDEPADDDDWDEFDTRGAEITIAFVRLCTATARRLHEAGVVEEVFGRALPIVIHELEYYDEIAGQTAEANPPGVADEFARWVGSLG